MSDRAGTSRAVTPVVGDVLLVALVVVLAITLTVLAFAFLEGLGTPRAEASFQYEGTAAGLRMTPTAISTPVVVKLNGMEVAEFDSSSAGKSVLLPTAPGDRITVVSVDGERSVLVDKTVDDRDKIGDFVAYYTFESGGGSTVEDRSGNDNEGTITGDPTWLTGDTGLRFDGSDDYVSIDDISAPVPVSEFTIAISYRQRGSDDRVNQLLEHRDPSTGNEWFLETIDSGTDQYAIDFAVEYPSHTISSAGPYATGDRHVVVGTYDGDTYDLYVDGDQVANDTFASEVNMGDMKLARDLESDIQYLDGDVYEMRLYHTAFDDAEVEVVSDVMAGG
jgi:FlaG/FlaF family flagellin (archaellin)